MAPSYLTGSSFRFLGQPTRPGQGVNPVMADVLRAVEKDMRATWESLGRPEGDFHRWATPLNEAIIGWRRGHGFHASGSAVDFNVELNPYIATRTGQTLGGEAGGSLEDRRRAVEVYDRAVAFFLGTGNRADVSIRVNDSIEVTYDRFKLVSDALVIYLTWAVSSTPARIRRPPIPKVWALRDGDPAFNAIGPDERWREPADAIARIKRELHDDSDWVRRHPDAPPPTPMYWQMLRDYEMVRTPMLHGKASEPVRETRNPARGFLWLSRELVCSMIHVGGRVLGDRGKMRWGASDFSAHASGDIMHFDLGGHAGHTPE